MISIKMNASSKYLRSLRLFASGLGLDLDFDIEKIEDLKVLISEAVNYKLGGEDLRINFIQDGKSLKIKVVGKDTSPDEKAISMRDAILRALADDVKIEKDLIEIILRAN